MQKQIILYGAGRNAVSEYNKAISLGYIPIAFSDKQPSKIGLTICGLPILSFDDAIQKSRYIWITVLDFDLKCRIIESLMERGFSIQEIVNYEDYEIGRHCKYLDNAIAVEDDCLFYCCEFHKKPVFVIKHNNVDDAIQEALQQKKELIGLISNSEESGTLCDGCNKIVTEYKRVNHDYRISTISMGFNAFCNAGCIYCKHRNIHNNKISPEKQKAIDCFDWRGFFESIERHNIMGPNPRLLLASGEITCNPRKDEILDIVEGYNISILSNAILFDSRIAEITAKVNNILNVSVDAGTRETYRIVKGVNAWDKVVANLQKYAECRSNIELKFILLEQNTNKSDADGFIQLAKQINAMKISITADFFRDTKYTHEEIDIANYIKTKAASFQIDCIVANLDERLKIS